MLRPAVWGLAGPCDPRGLGQRKITASISPTALEPRAQRCTLIEKHQSTQAARPAGFNDCSTPFRKYRLREKFLLPHTVASLMNRQGLETKLDSLGGLGVQQRRTVHLGISPGRTLGIPQSLGSALSPDP